MNFEGYQDLIRRVARTWWALAKKHVADLDKVETYLSESPMTAKQTPENEEAYEQLMDVRMKLYEISYEIDNNHDSYMEFTEQALETPDLLNQLVEGLPLEEKHLIYLELMIIEQVQDWEVGTGKVDQGSTWNKSKKMVVTLPNGSTRTLSIEQEFHKRYWFGLCPVSNKMGNVKLCAGCRVVGYIGKEEQKEDWPEHKKLCKVLTKARGGGDHWIQKIPRADDMAEFMRRELGKKFLTQFELDITQHPRICIVTGSAKQNDLKNCKLCNCVAFSSGCLEEGTNLHKENCEPLRIAAEDYRNEVTLGHQVQNYKPTIVNAFKRLPENIERFFSSDVAHLVSNKLPGYQDTEMRYLTFLYSCPLTVLYGLEQAGHLGSKFAQPIEERTELSIHVVGTRIAEMRHLVGWEILSCRLPKLKTLKIHFIGDETPAKEFPREFSYKSKELQFERKKLEVKYFCEPPMLYQDFTRMSGFSAPDAVVALDCGFKFYPTWRPAIKEALNFRNVPLIFTEFTLEDMKDNLSLVQSQISQQGMKLDIPVAPTRNPFCSKRPVRCTDKTGNYKPHSVIYTNDFICVVKPVEDK